MKDFFDEEYEKQQQNEAQSAQQGDMTPQGAPQQDAPIFDSWYNTPAPPPQKKSNKPWYIVLMCVAVIACIGLGYLLCFIVDTVKLKRNYVEGVYSQVVKYLKDNYYQDITDEQWTAAVEASGTALMQSAGDRYCQLMSPQTYYDFRNPVPQIIGDRRIFGISYVLVSNLGLYVTNVIADTAAYGNIYAGDIILELTNMRTSEGNAPTLENRTFDSFTPGDWAESTVETIMARTDSATAQVLRKSDAGYRIVSVPLRRSLPFQANSRYNYQFVEFYFGRNLTNVSTRTNKASVASVSTEEMRCLDALPADTGYIRVVEFMDYLSGTTRITAKQEFQAVLQLFKDSGLKHLILDLKGNPGGNVDYVSEIAAMLVTDGRLTDAQKRSVTSNGELLMTYLDMPKPSHVREPKYCKSSYFKYFDPLSDKCDIAVWTDGNSASASELLTGCLLDYGMAVQMGTTTYGKGIAQTWEELPYTGEVTDVDGNKTTYHWAVYYTCANYFSPLGTNIHGIGYTPADPYNNLSTYAELMGAVQNYWG